MWAIAARRGHRTGIVVLAAVVLVGSAAASARAQFIGPPAGPLAPGLPIAAGSPLGPAMGGTGPLVLQPGVPWWGGSWIEGPPIVGSPPIVWGPAFGTSVQLPSFQFTTVSTSVLVPDGGGALLGGIGSSQRATFQNGPFLPGRAGGVGTAAGAMQVTAQVHDLRALDAATLAAARGTPATQPPAEAAWTARFDAARQSSAGRGDVSVAELRRQQAAGTAARLREAEELLRRAADAEAAGQPGLARLYYRLAAEKGVGPVAERARAELARLGER